MTMDEESNLSLDDLLEDTPEAEAIPRDDHGRFAAKETGVEPEAIQAAPEPVPPTDRLPQEDYKAVREEREKRQTLERELQALRQQFEQAQNPPAPPPSIWEDDAGALDHVKNEAVTTAVQQATYNAKLDMSEMMVRQANPDFEEVKAEFLALAQQNPTLAQQALADPHPWNKAYQIAKNHKTMTELGAVDVNDLREKLRAEIMAEAQLQPRQGIPATLTGARNVGARSGPAWAGPASLDDLLR